MFGLDIAVISENTESQVQKGTQTHIFCFFTLLFPFRHCSSVYIEQLINFLTNNIYHIWTNCFRNDFIPSSDIEQ